jgi:O-antigen/teichoic acid export membrane protein
MLARLKTLAQTARTHAGFRRYAANTSWMFAEQILRMVAGLLVGIWVARYLGPEQFGLFSYAVAFAALFSSIAKLGLDSIVVRDLVRNPEQRDVYLGTAFWLKMIGAGFMLCAIALAMHFTSSDNTTKLYIFIIACGSVFQAFEVVDFYFQSKVLSKFVSICKLTQLFISSLLKLYLIYTGAGLFWFVVVSLVDQLTLAATLYFSYRYQKIGRFFGHFKINLAKTILKDSWPLVFSGIAVAVYMRIDQIMIKEMLGERDVGLYSAAVRLSEVWYFVPVIIMNSLFPAIANAKKIGEGLYLERLQRLCTVITWLAITGAIFITMLSGWLLPFLYGQSFQESGHVLAIHIWASVFVFLGISAGSFFTIENMAKRFLYRTILAAVTNVLLNFVLIPRFGIYGAATATVLSQFVANYLIDLIEKDTRRLFIIKTKALFPIYISRQ